MATSDKSAREQGKPQKIRISKTGPYKVSGGIPLIRRAIVADAAGTSIGWRESAPIPVEEEYELCRCGRSQDQPFCDDTHKRIPFDGAETASRQLYMEQARTFRGPNLDLTDAQSFCASARFCHRSGGAWKLTKQSGDPEARRIAIEEAGDCPSGRLVAWDKEGHSLEPTLEPSIGLIEDTAAGVSGPLSVTGGVTIESADGAVYETRNRVTLCRCGRSQNKPFCDSSHLER